MSLDRVATLAGAGLALWAAWAWGRSLLSSRPFAGAASPPEEGDALALGVLLFRDFVAPVELLGLLLLAALPL